MDRINDWLRSVYGGRPFLVAFDVEASAVQIAEHVEALGGRAAALGTGVPVELDTAIPHRALGLQSKGLMAGLRAAEAALDAVPAEVQAWADGWDPARQAQAIRAIYTVGGPVAQRPCFGERPAAWLALEDKLTVDALWDAAGVPRAPSKIVDLDDKAAVDAAFHALASPEGAVIAVDNTLGWHGGAEGTRHARSAEELLRAASALRAQGSRARVMPYLDGVPCSIHALVGPRDEAVFRPCEMLVLRGDDSTFQYASAATFWDPPPARREEMRDRARRVARYLRKTYDYRGMFTIDGVMTAEGFLPTELNPRYGGAASSMSREVKDLRFYLFHLALIAEPDCPLSLTEVEETLLPLFDAHRSGRCYLDVRPEKQLEGPVNLDLDLQPTDGQPAVQLTPTFTPTGPAWVAALLDIPVGPPARDLVARLIAMSQAD